MVDIISISKLLKMNLAIPNYQRPYKWSTKNVADLLGDIEEAITSAEKHDDFKYRVGAVILHKVQENDKVRYDIVDGQQRIITLILLNLYLAPFECPILEQDFGNKITQANIKNNYFFIRDYFSLKDNDYREKMLKAIKNTIEVVMICVDRVTEAFQLFDSQNTRGRALDPHDLLKAYHLREMRDYPYEMRRAVVQWESVPAKEIRELFGLYLYPIKNWAAARKTITFTAKEIDTYKGISESSPYTYAKRANNAMPYYQITAPFLSGGSFFEMTGHYIELIHNVKEEIRTNPKFASMQEIISNKAYASAGFSYATNLFYCALLCYYDKFRNFDERAVKKLFTWAFMLRVDMENLGFDSVNKYAIGSEEGRYTNSIPVFSVIVNARIHTEIANLTIAIRRDTDAASAEKWNSLYSILKEMNRIGGAQA